jgi:hypothetical protein
MDTTISTTYTFPPVDLIYEKEDEEIIHLLAKAIKSENKSSWSAPNGSTLLH